MRLIAVPSQSKLPTALTLALLAACGGAPPPPVAPGPPVVASTPEVAATPAPDPELDAPPPKRLLAIDWSTVALGTDAEANAVWAQIAPTGDDWEAKLEEVPVAAGRPLAIALLRGGNVTCVPPRPPMDCVHPPLDVDPPAPTAGLGDPCLRRMLALWSIAQLEDDDLPKIKDALRAIAAVPPPESQLVAAAIEAIPEDQHADRLELIAIAFAAGQHELANRLVGPLDEAHLIAAVQQHHIDGALEMLSAEAHRAVYLRVITDERVAPRARAQAIGELISDDDKLTPETRTALVAAAKAKDCLVAAAAARALEIRGEPRYVPRRPRTRSPDVMMRALCVLASYERLLPNDETSPFASFVPTEGARAGQGHLRRPVRRRHRRRWRSADRAQPRGRAPRRAGPARAR